MVFFFTAGEPYENVTKSTNNLEKRWESLQKMLSETKKKVEYNVNSKKFYDELNSLKDLVGTYEKWVGSAEIIAEDAADISKQVEQSKVRIAFKYFHILGFFLLNIQINKA